MKRKETLVGMCAFLMTLLAVFLIPGGMTLQAKKLSINQKTAYLAKGDTLQLKIKNAKASKVKWKSSKTKVATVSKNGMVKAKKTGKATITAKVNKKKFTCKVIVEKKTVNRARILRDYVLKKGKLDKKTGLITLKEETYDVEGDSETLLWSVAASKNNKKLTFRRYYVREDWYDSYEFTMTIDLISKKASSRRGKIKYRYYGPDDGIDDRYEGVVYTSADEDDDYYAAITQYGCMTEDPETGEETFQMEAVDPYSYNDENETLNFKMMEAFDEWDGWFKTIKGLKKYGISMKSIGFEWR